MNIGRILALCDKKLPASPTQIDEETKNPSECGQLLRAVVRWITYDEFLTVEEKLEELFAPNYVVSASKEEMDLIRQLDPILTLASNNVTQIDENGRTILHLCLLYPLVKRSDYSTDDMKNDARLIKTLCKCGASVTAEDYGGDTPLGIALAKKRMDLVGAMVRFSTAKPTDCNNHGDTILHVLLKNYVNGGSKGYKKFLGIVDELLSKITDLNRSNKNGETPVLLTAKPHLAELLEKLKNRGARLNCRTINGDNLIILACKYNDATSGWIDWLLRDIGFDPNSTNHSGLTPLYYASRENNAKVMKVLVEAGADVHIVTRNGTNLLHLATMSFHFDAMHYLIERGVAFNRRDIVQGVILMHMILLHKSSDERSLEWLIERGYDRSERGDLTVLHLAASYGYVRIVRKLIQLGADVNSRDDTYQYTPLHLAVMKRRFATVSELYKAGLRNGKVEDGFSRLSIRAHTSGGRLMAGFEIDYTSTAFELLASRADVNAKDRSKRTPLHYATMESSGDFQTLLIAGAHVDVQDHKYLTPLHNCLLSGNDQGLTRLIAFGADINDIEHPRRDICKEIRGLDSHRSGVRHHLVKLTAAGLPVNDLYEPDTYDEVYLEYYDRFVEELGELKKRMVTPKVSLHDWMQMNSRRRFIYIDNLPPRLKDEFQHYGVVLQGLRNQAISRNELMGPAKTACRFVTGVQWPDLCVEHIFSFLNNRTLRVLIDIAEES